MARVLDSAGTSQPIKALIEKVKEKQLTSSTERFKVYHKQDEQVAVQCSTSRYDDHEP